MQSTEEIIIHAENMNRLTAPAMKHCRILYQVGQEQREVVCAWPIPAIRL